MSVPLDINGYFIQLLSVQFTGITQIKENMRLVYWRYAEKTLKPLL